MDKMIQGKPVREFAYLFINGGCPIHQWASGARGIDDGVIEEVGRLAQTFRTLADMEGDVEYRQDADGLAELLAYLQENKGAPATPYIPSC